MSATFFPRLALLFVLGAAAVPAAAQTYVCLDTNQGDICLDLLPESAPNTVANFLTYVNEGKYDGTLIHLSAFGIVIQGGAYYGGERFGEPVPERPPILNEYGRPNLRGTVAMAKFADDPNSAAAEWFINLNDNLGFDINNGGYTVFAEVVSGLDVADWISALPRFDLSQYGEVFGAVPAAAPAGANPIALDELIVVERAYATDVLPGSTVQPPLRPYQCSATSPADTLTEFCGTTLSFPVSINGDLYEATLRYRADLPGLAFAVDREALKAMTDNGGNRAMFSNNELIIPDVRVGANAYQNVRLRLSDPVALVFSVTSYAPR